MGERWMTLPPSYIEPIDHYGLLCLQLGSLLLRLRTRDALVSKAHKQTNPSSPTPDII